MRFQQTSNTTVIVTAISKANTAGAPNTSLASPPTADELAAVVELPEAELDVVPEPELDVVPEPELAVVPELEEVEVGVLPEPEAAADDAAAFSGVKVPLVPFASV